MSGYVCGGCGCGYHSDYKEDCYFYNEEHDMGARVHWCRYGGTVKTLNECPKNCENYVSEKDVSRLVTTYIHKHWYDGHFDGLSNVQTASNNKSQWVEARTVGELIDILKRFDMNTKVCYSEGGGEIMVDCEADEPNILWF